MKSKKTKNEYCREMLKACKQNSIEFRYVLMDSWYSGQENMNFIVKDLKKSFIVSLKENRTVKRKNSAGEIIWVGEIENLQWGKCEVEEVYVDEVDFPVYVTRIIFRNEDEGTGIMHLCSDDKDLTRDQMLKIYQKRWGVEEFYRSAKQNASLGKSPASVPGSQINHILCAMYGYIKLEWMKMGSGINHYAMRSRMYLEALRGSIRELKKLKESINYPLREVA